MVGFIRIAKMLSQTFTFGFSATGLAMRGKMNSLPNLGPGEVTLSSFNKRTEGLQLSRKNSSCSRTPLHVGNALRCAQLQCHNDKNNLAPLLNSAGLVPMTTPPLLSLIQDIFFWLLIFLFRILTSGWHVLPACRKRRVTCLSFFCII